jgi:hypothetical protein
MVKDEKLKKINKLTIHKLLLFYTNVIALSKNKPNDQNFGTEVRKLCKN